MLKNIPNKNFIYYLINTNFYKNPMMNLSRIDYSFKNKQLNHQFYYKHEIAFSKSNILFYHKNKIIQITKNFFCTKSIVDPEKSNIDLSDESSGNNKKILNELKQLFENLKPDFTDKEKLLNFIHICAKINQNKFLKQELYIKYIEEILKIKTEPKFSDENLEIILEIFTSIFNFEDNLSHQKWTHFYNYLAGNKSQINFNILINRILVKVNNAIIIIDNDSNNKTTDNAGNHESGWKSLKNVFYDKIFDLFLLENIYEIQKFASCNYQEGKLLIKLFTPQFIERNPEILQSLLNNIFTIYSKVIFKNNLKEFIELADFLLNKHNFYYFCEILSKQIQNIKKLIPNSEINEIIPILSFYNLLLIEYSSLMTEDEFMEFEFQLKKLLHTVEKEVMLEINKIEIKEFFILLDNITRLRYDSKDFYSDVFDHFEKLIKSEKIPANYFYMLLDVYCRTAHKPKFIDLLVHKIPQAIPDIKPENFSNFLRILFSIDNKKVQILSEAEGFIMDNLGKVDDVAFANFVFAFCNKEYKKSEIFAKLEEEAFVRFDNMCENNNYDSFIDILYNFIYSKKTTIFIHNIMKEKLLKDSFKIEKIHSQSALKIFNIFKELGVKYPVTSAFDYFLCVNAHEFVEDDLKELNGILVDLNYKGSQFYEQFFLKCLEIKNPYERIDLANRFVKENI